MKLKRLQHEPSGYAFRPATPARAELAAAAPRAGPACARARAHHRHSSRLPAPGAGTFGRSRPVAAFTARQSGALPGQSPVPGVRGIGRAVPQDLGCCRCTAGSLGASVCLHRVRLRVRLRGPRRGAGPQ
ncbi:hypothetical protein B6S59_29930 [Pseudomonas sp. A46]|nr:hypothetical protein B6S59_29930 [Pseudomonas sp. A46]